MAVELKKGQKVSLEKKGTEALGEILINLNWNQGEPKKGFFAALLGGGQANIDLDLGCLYELKDGSKGVVQALGNTFGSLNRPPFIALDGDDRTGASTQGENLRVNGSKLSKIKKILVFTFIYEGVAKWKDVDGIVTVQCPGSQDIIVKMDDYNSTLRMCAIAMLENVNDETFSVEKLVQFFNGHKEMDKAFRWNMNWTPGRK